MSEPKTPEPLPLPIRELLALFTGPLEAARFPGVDRAVLESLADEVRTHASAVEHARAELESAATRLADGQAELLLKARQALSYAKVFAEDDAELTTQLQAIQLTQSARTGKKARDKKPAEDRAARGARGGDDKNDAKSRAAPGRPRGRPSASSSMSDELNGQLASTAA